MSICFEYRGSTGSVAALVAVIAAALVARRARSLSPSGTWAALAVGAAAALDGYVPAALLLVFFLSASALSRYERAEKLRRSGAIVEKGDERDARQVLANGAVFAIAAAAPVLWPCERTTWMAAAGGALAAACADTWSTEIGILSRTPPRSILTGGIVTPGTSGGVTAVGLGATMGGAALIGVAAWWLGWPVRISTAAAGGGIFGALADSIIGALWQARRRCPRCDALTERTVHDCGTVTVEAGGIAWLDNDGVNFLGTLIGALAAVALARWPA